MTIDWDNVVGDQESDEFLNVVQDNSLQEAIREPTIGHSVLHVVMTNNDNMVTDVQVGGQLGSNDHNLTRFKVRWDVSRYGNQVRTPDFTRLRRVKKNTWRRLSGTH